MHNLELDPDSITARKFTMNNLWGKKNRTIIHLITGDGKQTKSSNGVKGKLQWFTKLIFTIYKV